MGFWNRRAAQDLSQANLDRLARIVDDGSIWLIQEAAAVFPNVAAPITYEDAQVILTGIPGPDMTAIFLRNYMAFTLNLVTGFIALDTAVNVAPLDPDGLVFNGSTVLVAEIVETIENLGFFTDQGPRSEERAMLEVMKNVVEAVNAHQTN